MDPIFKLQPHRTVHLQGFDDYGAAFALWGASDTGFNDHSGGLQVKGKLGQKTSRMTPVSIPVSIVNLKTGALAPGETKAFRMAFDNVPEDWNQALPQMVIAAIDFS